MVDHQYEVECDCGARWRVTMSAPEDDDPMATCTSCGVDTFRLRDLGPCVPRVNRNGESEVTVPCRDVDDSLLFRWIETLDVVP